MHDYSTILSRMDIVEKQYVLRSLPTHLANLGHISSLENLLSTFLFIIEKLKTGGAKSLLSDYELVSSSGIDQIRHALTDCIDICIKDPLQLAPQLIGRLPIFQHALIEKLIEQAYEQTYSLSLLTPSRASIAQGSMESELKIHIDGRRVTALAFTPDQRRLIIGFDSSSSNLAVWDLESRSMLHTFSGHKLTITKIVPLPDNCRVLSASQDGTLRIWDIINGEELGVFEDSDQDIEHIREVILTEHGKKVFVAGPSKKSMLIWDINSREIVKRIPFTETVPWINVARAATISPCGNYYFFADKNYVINVYRTSDCMKLFSLKGHEQYVFTLAVTHDSQRLISGSVDQSVRVWNIDTGSEEKVLLGHQGTVTDILLDHKSRICITIDTRGNMLSWDIDKGVSIASATGIAYLNTTAISSKGDYIAFCLREPTSEAISSIQIWRIAQISGANKSKLVSKKLMAVNKPTFNMVYYSSNSLLQLENYALKKIEYTLGNNKPEKVIFSSNGAWLAAFFLPPDYWENMSTRRITNPVQDTPNIYVEIWDLTRLKKRTMTFDVLPMLIDISSDGQMLVTVQINQLKDTRNHELVFWDIGWMKAINRQPLNTVKITKIKLSQNGSRLYIATKSGFLGVWRIRGSPDIYQLIKSYFRRWRNFDDSIINLTKTEHIGHGGKENQLLDPNLYMKMTSYQRENYTYPRAVNDFDITPDDRYCISGGNDGSIRIWNVTESIEVASIETDNPITIVSISDDGKWFVFVSTNNTIELWMTHGPKFCAKLTYDSEVTYCSLTILGEIVIYVITQSEPLHQLKMKLYS